MGHEGELLRTGLVIVPDIRRLDPYEIGVAGHAGHHRPRHCVRPPLGPGVRDLSLSIPRLVCVGCRSLPDGGGNRHRTKGVRAMVDGRFHGLFVGLDNYAAPQFKALNYAKRDAAVLHALFWDAFDEKPTLVTDADATKDRLLTEIGHLASVSTDEDVVVLTYSGHGTSTGELATYNADPDRLEATALRLDEFVTRVESVRARVLIVALDCCFSGGALAKVLRRPEEGRASRGGLETADRALSRVSGNGRVVLAASTAHEKAFEVHEFGHGLLSHYLIQGLLGRGNVIENGEIPVFKLAEYVLRMVGEHESGMVRRRQTPSFGGNLGNLSLPVFTKGEHYEELKLGSPISATWALSSLEQSGIPVEVLRLWRDRIGRLNRLQVDAINHAALLDGNNVLVSAPTSSGKTMVGELAALHAVAHGRKAVFLLPSRALVNELYERFKETYGTFEVRAIRVTGELRDQVRDLLTGEFELAVCTYEKFIGLLFGRPELLDRIGVIVVDEIQSLVLPDRGPLLEILFTWIRMRRVTGNSPQIVGLSAVLGEPQELAWWLNADLVQMRERETPLLEGVVDQSGRYRYRDQDGTERTDQFVGPPAGPQDDLATRLVRELVGQGQQVIVFRGRRDLARSFAAKLARELRLPSAETVLDSLPQSDSGRLADLLRGCLAGGVAFHVSDLNEEERRLLERSFKEAGSEIRVVVATTTLAQGVNLPADAVVICELDHPTAKYAVSEYKNMAGRAGRTGHVAEGRSFIVTRGGIDTELKWAEYVMAESEPVRSALLDPSMDLRTLVLSAFTGPAVTPGRASVASVTRFISWTFGSHQSGARGGRELFSRKDVRTVLADLEKAGFLRSSRDEYTPTRLGEIVVQQGLSVDSVMAIAEALAAVPPDGMNRMTLICAAHLAVELEDTRFSRNSSHRNKEYNSLRRVLERQKAAEAVLLKLMADPGRRGEGLARARRSIACLRWSTGIPLFRIERELTEVQALTKGETGPVQQTARRTADIIDTVVDIGRHVNPAADFGDLPDVLAIQLELGIAKGLVPIARYVDGILARPVYLGLARNGLGTVDSILAAEEPRVLEGVGGRREIARIVLDAAEMARAEAERGDLAADLPDPED
ncbi:DEAD/DEAH box helicase [Actinomadura rubteroloni]|nr:DEAD/DEAH box helicase [Actinomadura rubteroloni]